ncbi:MAG: hypothetical protein AAGA91_12955 [Pseudomonadota bacterium]
MNGYHTKTRMALTACVMSTLAACAQNPQTDTAHCSLSQTNSVERVFLEVTDKLQDPVCHYSYPMYRERLVAAAKGSPGPENEARFAALLRESIDLGVISKRQGQEVFSQYFDPEFYVVKAEPRSSCTSLRRRNDMALAMRKELDFKREGMLEILGDEGRFRQAQHYYSDLTLVFEAVDTACTQEG